MHALTDTPATISAKADWSRFPLPLAAKIVAEADKALPPDALSARASLRQLAHLFDLCARPPQATGTVAPDAGVARGGLASWQLRRVFAHIENNLAQTIHIETLAQLTRLSDGHFCRAFKASVGETPHGYITRKRLEEAKMMMLTTTVTLSQIACACGMTDQAHLSRLFRQYVGETPLVWRRTWQVAA